MALKGNEKRDYTEKIAKALASISNGESVRKSCIAAEIALVTFLDNVDGEQYARARTAQADAQFVEMNDLEQQCLRGEIDPQAYRVAMDTRKWRLARMHPKYNDKVQLEVSGPDKGPIQVADLAMMDDAQLQAILGHKGGNE